MGQVMQLASFSLAEVQYITGDIGFVSCLFSFFVWYKFKTPIHFSYQIQEASKSAQLRVRAKQENVSGVMLPAFDMYTEGGNGNYMICRENNMIYTISTSFWIHWSWSWWSTNPKGQRSLYKSSRDISWACQFTSNVTFFFFEKSKLN
jgi:hypothetical protein